MWPAHPAMMARGLKELVSPREQEIRDLIGEYRILRNDSSKIDGPRKMRLKKLRRVIEDKKKRNWDLMRISGERYERQRIRDARNARKELQDIQEEMGFVDSEEEEKKELL